MQYNAPLDQPTNPNAPYVDGNPQAGIQGSIVPAASIEFDQREVVEVITRANVRGYSDFTGTRCAAPTNADLTELRKAIEGFVSTIVIPEQNPFVIDTEVTFTVHGPGANFTDLHAAMNYLARYKITQTGHAILQLAGASSGHAAQYVYTSPVIINHPNNDRISILGAPMLAPLPLSDAGYASNGPSTAQRAADLVTNLAILRNHFATELHFSALTTGLWIFGLCPMHLDSILITGIGSNSGYGIMFNCSGYINIYPTSAAGNWAYGGLAVAQMGVGMGWDVGACVSLGGEAYSQNLVTPLLAIGCGQGFAITNGGFLTSSGNLISLGNDGAGFYTWPRGGNQLDGGVFCCSNGSHGYQTYLSSTTYAQGPVVNGAVIGPCHFYKNGGWGVFGESGHLAMNADCGSGANANGLGSMYALNACFINVFGGYNVPGCSPPIGVVGNGNSVIQPGW